jgi:hypothetical protein
VLWHRSKSEGNKPRTVVSVECTMARRSRTQRIAVGRVTASSTSPGRISVAAASRLGACSARATASSRAGNVPGRREA